LVASALGPPPAILRDTKLDKVYLKANRLVRVSRYTSGEPFFGKSGNNRFDAPGCAVAAPEYGACYMGTSLAVALSESLLHDAVPVNGKFQVAVSMVRSLNLLTFDGSALHLLDLTGARLKRLGGTADLVGTIDYGLTQQWAHAVYLNPAGFDGFLYMSRHYNVGRAAILFDHASAKIRFAGHAPLAGAHGFARAQRQFGIELS